MKKYKEKFLMHNESVKNWLSKNKIYFETLVMVSLTVAGILLSFLSISVSKTANQISQASNQLSETANQLSSKSNEIDAADFELQKNKMLPVFTRLEEFEQNKYLLINTGDRCIEPALYNHTILLINCHGNGTDIKGKYFKNINMRFEIGSLVKTEDIDRDTGNCEISISELKDNYIKFYSQFSEDLEDKIEENYSYNVTFAGIQDYLFFRYKDVYLKETHVDAYKFYIHEGTGGYSLEVSDDSWESVKELPLLSKNYGEMELNENAIDIAIAQLEELDKVAVKEYY